MGIGIFDDVKYILDEIVGNNHWIKRKSNSFLNLETCNGEAINDSITNTCELCVALNETVFKDYNKPDYMHPHCKCFEVPINSVNIVIDFSPEKVTEYLFVNMNKKAMMRSMGYTIQDWKEIYDLISYEVKINFVKNKYILRVLNVYGQHFQVNFILYGKNDHHGEEFQCHSGCIAYPNGKIKIATPLIKDK